jgi:hypothetical protein
VTPDERTELQEKARRIAKEMGVKLPLRDDGKPNTNDAMNSLIRGAARRQPRETTEGETRDA